MIGLIFRLAWLLAWFLTLPLRFARRFTPVPRGTYLLVEIDGAIDEIPPARPRWSLLPRPRFSLQGLAAIADEMARDPRVKGLLVVARSVHGGFATVTSLRALLTRIRTAGKEVVVYLPLGGGTKETFCAVAADRVLLAPQAELSPVGVLSSTPYVRGALDRAGVVPEVHARGRYKTVAEPLELRSMSQPQREQLDAVLDRVHSELLRSIAEGRRVDEARARELVDGAPYVGEEARTAGLVDAVAYEDELEGHLAGGRGSAVIRHADRYLRRRRALRSRAFESLDAIAVIRIHGVIAGAAGLPFRSVSSAERVIAAIRLARMRPRVRGVVLHVDSPGGSALASDRIHRELVRLAADKPVVACMANVAASGGYYVAAAAHEIVAQPSTITGSIGVVSARLVLEPLLVRLGIATEVLQRGQHARLLDPFLALDDGAKRAIDRELDAIYRAFVEVVARGRRRSPEEIELLAQGRVWSGADAQVNGLVDRLGGFDVALEAVRSKIGAGAERLRIVTMRSPRQTLPSFGASARQGAARLVADVAESAVGVTGHDVGLLSLLPERVLVYSRTAAAIRI